MGKPDGGPAFPDHALPQRHNGMSLRDYFAGQALAGILASSHLDTKKPADELATNCYRIADAMIAEREK